MPKTPEEIEAKVQELFAMAKESITPVIVLSTQTTILMGKKDWAPTEVEIVGTKVISLLTQKGWKKPSA
jgi:hypothetical protein